MTEHEISEVVMAKAAGKAIQSQVKGNRPSGHWPWEDDPNPQWNFGLRNYRVKPEPLVLWVNQYGPQTITVHLTKSSAENSANSEAKRVAVRLVETPE